MVALMAAVAIMMIMLAAAVPSWRYVMRNDAEEELIFRGGEIADADGTPVICTQGKVIPDLIAWWCERDGVRPDKSRNRKGSTWVLSSVDGHLIAADHIGSPLAVLE